MQNDHEGSEANMVRFSKEDKKLIAKAQKQEVFDEDEITGYRRLIGYRCKKCRRKLPLDILEVDHIKPRALKGKDNPSNLQLLCPPCNKKKGARVVVTSTSIKAKSIAGRKKSSGLKAKTTRR